MQVSVAAHSAQSYVQSPTNPSTTTEYGTDTFVFYYTDVVDSVNVAIKYVWEIVVEERQDHPPKMIYDSSTQLFSIMIDPKALNDYFFPI